MKKNIVIVSCASTGLNYIDDIKYRGYNPVIVDAEPVGNDESIKPIILEKENIYNSIDKNIPVIKDYKNYEELLEKVKAYDPLLVVVGEEFGVEIGTQLADDLGLPGTPRERIPYMTEKAKMHQTLKEHGLRCIEGKIILNEMGDTKRYGDCYIYNYEYLLHHDTTEEFGACMIDLPDRTTVVCFLGTDDHMIGWKEDLYLSYKNISSQDDALYYVNKYCTSLFRKYRVIGHSKGGHLALYAAVACKPSIKKKILEVYSNDGPGLRPDSFDPSSFEAIKDRYRLIVPEKDGIGTIFELPSKRVIAGVSTKNLVEAHGIMSWNVQGNRIMRADNDSYQTDKTRIALDRFIRESTPEQKEIFIEEKFNLKVIVFVN